MSNRLNPDYFVPEKQQTRCFLRERFLRAIGNATGKHCVIQMDSNTTVSGIFRGNDIEFKNILVDNLKTPIAQLPNSILRSTDVLHITFDDIFK